MCARSSPCLHPRPQATANMSLAPVPAMFDRNLTAIDREQVGATACLQCGPGSFCAGGTDRTPCPNGTWSGATAATAVATCTACLRPARCTGSWPRFRCGSGPAGLGPAAGGASAAGGAGNGPADGEDFFDQAACVAACVRWDGLNGSCSPLGLKVLFLSISIYLSLSLLRRGTRESVVLPALSLSLSLSLCVCGHVRVSVSVSLSLCLLCLCLRVSCVCVV